MRFARKSGAVACATAVSIMFGVVATASPAQADRAVYFRLRNVTTGTCLKYNGIGKVVTQVKCGTAMNQYWGKAGVQLIAMGDRLPGLSCLTSGNGHELKVKVKDCDGRRESAWLLRTTAPHQKTTVGGPVCGYLKVISGNVVCGKRVAGDRDNWEIY